MNPTMRFIQRPSSNSNMGFPKGGAEPRQNQVLPTGLPTHLPTLKLTKQKGFS